MMIFKRRLPTPEPIFQAGDTVAVKYIQGPVMIVERVVSAEAGYWTGFQVGIHCVWFDVANVRRAGVFAEEVLCGK